MNRRLLSTPVSSSQSADAEKDPNATTGAVRSAYIDRIRIALTCLVIAHHAAIVYGGSGGWYWREEPNASNLLLVGFNALNQSFFMGFFFLFAGYYTPAAYERKGERRFLSDRLSRLGLPLLVYFVLLSPLTIALAQIGDGLDFATAWRHAFRVSEFEPGPLWFAEALLIFALAYALWRRVRPNGLKPRNEIPGYSILFAWSIGLGGISFALRLFFPTGQSVAWLQLGYFPCYVFLFAAGCCAARGRLLEKISFAHARPFVVAAAVATASLPFALARPIDGGAFEGGWSFNALYYALWDPVVAWGVILGALWVCRTHWNRSSRIAEWLSRRAYGAFITHPPLLVASSLLLHSWQIPPLAKFLLAAFVASSLSFATASLLLRLPQARRVL